LLATHVLSSYAVRPGSHNSLCPVHRPRRLLKKLYAAKAISATSTIGPSTVVKRSTNKILNGLNDPRPFRNRSLACRSPSSE
jgi:hypothetical protein